MAGRQSSPYGYRSARDYCASPTGYESPRQGYQDYIYVPQGYHTPDVDYDSRDDYDQAESSGDERRAALRRQENERMRNAWIAAEQRRAQDVQRRNDPRARNGGQLRRATSHRVAKCTKGLAMHNPYDCQCSDCCDDVEFYTAAQDANRAQKMLVGPTPREVLPYRREQAPDHRQTVAINGDKITFRLVKRIGSGGQG